MDKEIVSIGTMYRTLLTRVKGLIISPRKEWSIIFNERQSINEVLVRYTLPLIAIFAISVFLGHLFSVKELDIEFALKNAAFGFSAYFFGLFVGYYLLFKLMVIIRQPIDKEIAFKLVAFPSGVVYIVWAITGLFTEMLLLGYLVNMYVIYIVLVAIKELDNAGKESRVLQTFFISAVILLVPNLIQRILSVISEIFV